MSMKEIIITGRAGDLSKAEARAALSFFADKLLGPRLAKHVSIDLSFEKNLGDTFGFCNSYDYGRNPRNFEISLNSELSRVDQISTLAHEMVHVRQHARNQLKMYFMFGSWEGKSYKMDDDSYSTLPWEIEAYALEPKLAREYLETTRGNQ